jgi:hypothetical protein
MWVRFTGFTRYSGKELNLYFVQESQDPMKPAFTVYIKNDEIIRFSMIKEGDHNWTITSQNIPEWIFDAKPELTRVLEQHSNL